MKYTTPTVKTVQIADVLQQLGPARALLYVPGGGGDEQPDVSTSGSSSR